MRQRLKQFVLRQLARAHRWLSPPKAPVDLRSENKWLHNQLDESYQMVQALQRSAMTDARERIAELVEARSMTGTGPWRIGPETAKATDELIAAATEAVESASGRAHFASLREMAPPFAAGAYGDVELALQNVEWRREVNLSWLEFSRWGIQQIILISRLFFIKNSTIQRGVNVSAQYVFGRGVELSSPDETANEVLKDFMTFNAKTLGQVGLTQLERSKYYDGNLFFALFTDKTSSGRVSVRMIDATEIMDIITDPDDADTPRLYFREWTVRNFNINNGQTTTASKKAYYPALGWDPPAGDLRPATINSYPVNWDTPIHHRKCGAIVKWHFGVPLVYAALDWARASRRWLEACATVRQSLAQISMILTSKGGQQALEGIKQGLSTTVGPQAPIWDFNPTAVNASIAGFGSGTTLKPFNTTGAGGDPEDVRRFELMVWRVFGIPETFGGDVKTGNLATATSLDRPTELNFLEKQEAWREDLNLLGRYALLMSATSTNGKLFESMRKRVEGFKAGDVVVREARRSYRRSPLGNDIVVYEAAVKPAPNVIETMVTFPSIREGDIPQLVSAVVQAMTLGNTQGEVVGVDEKAGVAKLGEIIGIPKSDELVDQMYPEKGEDAYDPVRRKPDPEEEARLAAVAAGGAPQPGKPGAPGGKRSSTSEALRAITDAAKRLKAAL